MAGVCSLDGTFFLSERELIRKHNCTSRAGLAGRIQSVQLKSTKNAISLECSRERPIAISLLRSVKLIGIFESVPLFPISHWTVLCIVDSRNIVSFVVSSTVHRMNNNKKSYTRADKKNMSYALRCIPLHRGVDCFCPLSGT